LGKRKEPQSKNVKEIRFLFFAAIFLLLTGETMFIAYRLGILLGILGQLPAIAAGMVALYAWEKEQLKKRADLVGELRVCTNHFHYMTFQQDPASITKEEMKRIQHDVHATEIRLAEASSRSINMIGFYSDLGTDVHDFIQKLREFPATDTRRFLSNLKELQDYATKIGIEANTCINSEFKLRYVAAQKLLYATLIVFGICSIVTLWLLDPNLFLPLADYLQVL
jgi:hypothetical protein